LLIIVVCDSIGQGTKLDGARAVDLSYVGGSSLNLLNYSRTGSRKIHEFRSPAEGHPRTRIGIDHARLRISARRALRALPRRKKAPEKGFDFAADDEDAKKTARVMLQMVEAINRDYVSKIEKVDKTAPIHVE
jgi:hypothetical protein